MAMSLCGADHPASTITASQHSKMANTRSWSAAASTSRSGKPFDSSAKNGVYGGRQSATCFSHATSSWSEPMPEKIRYTWGSSSLGDFVVAASDQGLVAFEFSDDRVGMI
jgi:hypothetical protein